MKIPCDEYYLTHSVQEALEALSASPGTARVVAGGTDLLLEMQQGNHPPVKTLVDVTEVPEMCALEVRGGELFMGASVSLSRINGSALIKEHARALADAASLMANPQVCNVATIGGNVAHALPAADGTIALLALDAQVEIASRNGRRRLPLQSLFSGPGISTLDPHGDLLVGFYLPLSTPGEASAFSRRVNPQGIALALLNLAVSMKRSGERIKDIRIVVGPAGPVPMRMKAAEEIYRNQIPSVEIHTRSLEVLLNKAKFRTSQHRATAEYRRHLVSILLEEAFNQAWSRVGLADSP